MPYNFAAERSDHFAFLGPFGAYGQWMLFIVGSLESP